jgi:hypothetical protein
MVQWPTAYQPTASAEKIINEMQNKFVTALSYTNNVDINFHYSCYFFKLLFSLL